MAFLPPPCFKFTWQHLHRTGGFHKVPTAEISQELQMFCTLRIGDGKSLDLKNEREGILRGLVSAKIYIYLFLQDLKYFHENKRQKKNWVSSYLNDKFHKCIHMKYSFREDCVYIHVRLILGTWICVCMHKYVHIRRNKRSV